MPAIPLAKVRADVDQVCVHFVDTAAFLGQLDQLFASYANFAYKPPSELPKLRGITFYNAPPLLTNQLLMQLRPLLDLDFQQTQSVMDALWNSKVYEYKVLAVQLLRTVSASQPDWAIERIQTWLEPDLPAHFADLIFSTGTEHLVSRDEEKWMSVVKGWLNSDDRKTQKLGIQAAKALVGNNGFENLPPIYSGITRLVLLTTSETFFDLLDLLEALVKRAPAETAYFMRQIIGLGLTEQSTRLFRKMIAFYPDEEQQRLRKLLAGY